MSKTTTNKQADISVNLKPRWLRTPRSRLRTAIFAAVLIVMVLLNAALTSALAGHRLTVAVFAWSALIATYMVLNTLLPSDRRHPRPRPAPVTTRSRRAQRR